MRSLGRAGETSPTGAHEPRGSARENHSMSTSRTSRVLGLALAAATVAGPVVLLTPPASAAETGSFTKIQGAAGNAAGLQPTVDAYRALLGGADNGNTPGSVGSGRREINWDAVPDALSSPNAMPNDLFNTAVPRGAVFSSPTGQVQVSVTDAGGVPRFGDINPQYAHQFGTFSPEKLFAAKDSTQTRVRFFVPGTNTRAYVSGFGAVLTDVDKAHVSKIEVYDKWGKRLWKGDVPKGTKARKSLSFLGVVGTAKIAEVRITSGNVPLGLGNSDGSWKDVAAIDDLVYGEPKAY